MSLALSVYSNQIKCFTHLMESLRAKGLVCTEHYNAVQTSATLSAVTKCDFSKYILLAGFAQMFMLLCSYA